jgi:hypothetical protein
VPRRRGGRRGGPAGRCLAERDETLLDQLLDGARHGQLAELQGVTQAADGDAAADGHDLGPTVTIEGDLVAGQLVAERHPAAERGHDGLDGLPLVEHRLCCVERGLDVDRRTAVGGQGVGVEDEVALLEPQELEDDFGRTVRRRRRWPRWR